eukprot:8596959-Alexandrium_andersonii.AAC.1
MSLDTLAKLPGFQILSWRPRPRSVTRSARWGAAELGRGERDLWRTGISQCRRWPLELSNRGIE